MKKNRRGITLSTLVITIVVLAIVAGTAIAMVIDSDGIFNKTSQATEEWNTAISKEDKTTENVFDRAANITKKSKNKALKILINSGNDGIVVLPIGFFDKYIVDWGDGTEETVSDGGNGGNGGAEYSRSLHNEDYIQSKYRVASKDEIKLATTQETADTKVYHQYSETNTEFIVTIYGVNRINTHAYGCTKDKIIKILQWGELELVHVDLSGCSNLETIASPTENSFDNDIYFTIFFYNCTSLSNIPSDLFKYCTNAESFYFTFANCTSLTNIPEDLFKCCTGAVVFAATFAECTNLNSIPSNLFDNCPNVFYFSQTFYNCTGLTGQELPLWQRMENGAEYEYEPEYGYELERGPDGYGCYYNCTGLTNFSSIPEYWKAEDELVYPVEGEWTGDYGAE